MKAGGRSCLQGRAQPGLNMPASSPRSLAQWHGQLLDRRRFLLGAAGGSLALLFAAPGRTAPAAELDEQQRWAIIDAVQQQLFPDEADAPGAGQINALDYLQRVMVEPDRDPQERSFILQGAGWLQQLAAEGGEGGVGFAELDGERREVLLERIAASEAGENWLSTLLLFILEALLTDPVYGGNPERIGWQWLQHRAGFPQPAVPYYQLPFFRA